MKKIKYYISSILIGLAILAPVGHVAAQADIDKSLCAGANLTTDPNAVCDTTGAGTTVDAIVATVINIFSFVVGVIAVIMIIIGGIKYITSGGDSNNISSAKTTIIYAIIGLVVVALAQVVVRFVLNRVTTGTGLE
jgi:hypothetical protein